MIDTLLLYDEALFHALNRLPHTAFLNSVFLFFSFYPVILWFIIGFFIIVLEEYREKIFILRLICALLLAGWITSGIIKPIVKRPRPDILYGSEVIIVPEKPAAIPWNNDFAFPSGHAAVAFAGAYTIVREHSDRKRKTKFPYARVLYGIAFLTAVSRIYLGKHFPLDVVIGSGIGVGVGWVTWKIFEFFRPPRVV